jgi:hypothetical protein
MQSRQFFASVYWVDGARPGAPFKPHMMEHPEPPCNSFWKLGYRRHLLSRQPTIRRDRASRRNGRAVLKGYQSR